MRKNAIIAALGLSLTLLPGQNPPATRAAAASTTVKFRVGFRVLRVGDDGNKSGKLAKGRA